ncbi:6279_t:CDS:2 [Acaulospora colombiana]|uniref:6279_t:CDS:1 n=1 Tax=Acaulospora colombiana TaxID=27376 RepID=A0ACA9L351_9GLOM|nr:6279_t:CDS:2 [Acaulospora colombiana]
MANLSTESKAELGFPVRRRAKTSYEERYKVPLGIPGNESPLLEKVERRTKDPMSYKSDETQHGLFKQLVKGATRKESGTRAVGAQRVDVDVGIAGSSTAERTDSPVDSCTVVADILADLNTVEEKCIWALDALDRTRAEGQVERGCQPNCLVSLCLGQDRENENEGDVDSKEDPSEPKESCHPVVLVTETPNRAYQRLIRYRDSGNRYTHLEVDYSRGKSRYKKKHTQRPL